MRADAWEAYLQGQQGDFRASSRLLEELGPDTHEGRLLRCQRAFALDEDYAATLDRNAPDALAEEEARWLLLSAEFERLRAFADAHSAPLVQSWAALLCGDTRESLRVASSLFEDPLPWRRIEARAIASLAAQEEGALDVARMHARSASSEAKSERLPQSQYLANIVLARLRRVMGRSPLCLRILRALESVAPRLWHRWLSWEMGLAGAPSSLPDAEGWRGLFAALEAGSQHEVEVALGVLRERAPTWLAYGAELQELRALLGVAEAAQSELRAFLQGELHTAPPRLQGWFAERADQEAGVFTHVDGKGSVRRIPRVARALLSEIPHVECASRARLALCVLASAAQSEETFFRRVYGFGYEAEVHQAIVGTLLYRVRKALEGRAEVRRSGGQCRLVVHCPFLVADPRCERSLAERAIQFLSRTSERSTRAVADDLGVSLRSAQAALAELVADGSVSSEREGRSIAYRIEDTSFAEPTCWR